MMRYVLIGCVWMVCCGAASKCLAATFHSEAIGRDVTVRVMAPAGESDGPRAAVIYLKGLAEERLGEVDDATLIGELIDDDLIVLVIDYGDVAKAKSPWINADLLNLRREVETLAAPYAVARDEVYALPAGYRLARDIEFYRDNQKTYRLDVRYPAAGAGGAKVPLIIQIPHNNDARMNMDSIVKYRDSLLEGLMVSGYAVAVVAHPVAPPYGGIDAMPDAMYKLKSAVRTLRASASDFGYNATRFGVMGFSRGSGMAGLLATTGGVAALEGDGLHLDQSSAVQAALCQAGRFDHRTLMEDGFSAKTFDKYIAHFGDPVLHADRWDAASAARWVTADDPPFCLIVGGDDSYRVGQVRKLHEALLAVGAEHPYIIEQGRKHLVTENHENIATIGVFFNRVLKGNHK